MPNRTNIPPYIHRTNVESHDLNNLVLRNFIQHFRIHLVLCDRPLRNGQRQGRDLASDDSRVVKRAINNNRDEELVSEPIGDDRSKWKSAVASAPKESCPIKCRSVRNSNRSQVKHTSVIFD